MKTAQKYGVCLISAIILDWIIELLARRDIVNLLQFVIYSPITFAVNVILIFTTLCACFLFRHRRFMLVFLSSIWLIMGIINGVLLGFHFRTTPLTGQDLRLIKSAIEIAPKYLSPLFLILTVFGILAVILLMVLVYRKAPVYQGKLRRFQVGVMWILLIWLSLSICELGIRVQLFPSSISNIAEAYQSYGFVYCFVNSLLNTGIARPQGYGDDLMEEIVDSNDLLGESTQETEAESVADTELKESKSDVAGEESQADVAREESQADETQEETDSKAGEANIIFLQLESFFDITNANMLTFSDDPIPTLHRLQKEYSHGYISVPSIGAGTANTEFEVITGMNLDFFGPGEYPYKTILKKTTCESIAYDLMNLGWSTHAIHNNSATFYDRVNVFPGLGFETFTSLEYMREQEYTENGWVKDIGLKEEIRTVLDSTQGQDFVYTISVQGHGSYPEEEVLENPAILVDGEIETERKNAITYYTNQIYEMDEFVAALIEMLEQRDEPSVLVLFGDHLPTLQFTEEEIDNATLFQTPYIIWDNIGLECVEQDLESYQLYAWVLQQLDIHTGVMTRFHQAYFEDIDEINAADETKEETVVLGEEDSANGNDVEVSKKDTYLQEMELLEYDMLYGEQDVFDGTNPYEVIDMKMGVKEIEIQSVAYRRKAILVSGSNFTPYTKIFLNDKEVETEYISSTLVLAFDVEPKEQNDVQVKQVDKDGVVLSESEKFEYVYQPKE